MNWGLDLNVRIVQLTARDDGGLTILIGSAEGNGMTDMTGRAANCAFQLTKEQFDQLKVPLMVGQPVFLGLSNVARCVP